MNSRKLIHGDTNYFCPERCKSDASLFSSKDASFLSILQVPFIPDSQGLKYITELWILLPTISNIITVCPLANEFRTIFEKCSFYLCIRVVILSFNIQKRRRSPRGSVLSPERQAWPQAHPASPPPLALGLLCKMALTSMCLAWNTGELIPLGLHLANGGWETTDKCFHFPQFPLPPALRHILSRSAVCPHRMLIFVLLGGQVDKTHLYWLCLLLFLSSSPALWLFRIMTICKQLACKPLVVALLVRNLG